MRYDEMVRRLRRPLDPDGGVRELVRLATLAANSHNTQPWRFVATARGLRLEMDAARRCPVVDPDDHHTLASLGCAVENAVRVAPPLGLDLEVRIGESAIELALSPRPRGADDWSEAIRRRQCTRGPYAGEPLAKADLTALTAAGAREGVAVVILDDRARCHALADVVAEAARAQLGDPAFRGELFAWMRTTDAAAVREGDGLSARVVGAPRLPRVAVRALLPLVLDPARVARRARDEVRNSGALAVFVGARQTPAGWIEVGRAYQGFALEAARRDLRHAFVNQPVEVPSFRADVAAIAGLDGCRPDLIVRLGRAPLQPYALRRPVAAVFRG